jgi:hypothetical protein
MTIYWDLHFSKFIFHSNYLFIEHLLVVLRLQRTLAHPFATSVTLTLIFILTVKFVQNFFSKCLRLFQKVLISSKKISPGSC